MSSLRMVVSHLAVRLVAVVVVPFVMWGLFLWIYKPVARGEAPVTLFPTPSVAQLTPQPTPVVNSEPPAVSARSYIVEDFMTRTVLTQENAEMAWAPASTTKMMTALIALEHFSVSDVVTVPWMAVEGAHIALQPGEQITVQSLLYGMLIQSGNDAAKTLAMQYPGGEEAFVEAMNQKAQELGLEHTHFMNPTGLDDPLHLSSTKDLVTLARTALTHPTFAEIVSIPKTSVTSTDGTIVHELKNINQLLTTVEGVKGVKTGWTEEAGEALVTLVERNGHSVLLAVLGSADRFGDTKALIEWVYGNTVWP